MDLESMSESGRISYLAMQPHIYSRMPEPSKGGRTCYVCNKGPASAEPPEMMWLFRQKGFLNDRRSVEMFSVCDSCYGQIIKDGVNNIR